MKIYVGWMERGEREKFIPLTQHQYQGTSTNDW